MENVPKFVISVTVPDDAEALLPEQIDMIKDSFVRTVQEDSFPFVIQLPPGFAIDFKLLEFPQKSSVEKIDVTQTTPRKRALKTSKGVE